MIRIINTALECVYKFFVVLIYSALIVTGVYFLCSKFAPMPPIEQYYNFKWVLGKVVSQHKLIGDIAEFLQSLFDISMNARTFTSMDVVKELINGFVVIIFVQLGTFVYGLFSGFAHSLFFGRNVFSKIIDGVCTLLIIMTAVLFSQIALDAIFAVASPDQYIWVALGIALLLIALCLITLLFRSNKSVVETVFDLVLGVGSLLLTYTTVLVFEELTCYSHSAGTYLFLILVLIICIGLCTAVGTYYVSTIKILK